MNLAHYELPASPAEIIAQPELFFEQHKDSIRQMYHILDMPTALADSLDATVEATQPWTRGDHSRPEHQFMFNDEQTVALHGLFETFGLTQTFALEPGHYDHLIVPGAVQTGNLRRMAFMRDQLASGAIVADTITLLGGQRRMFPEREKGDVEATFEHIDLTDQSTNWSENMRARPSEMWETDMMRLAAISQLGALPLRQLHLRLANAEVIQHYELDWKGHNITLMHTLAVARNNGEPRHTTESCVADWVHMYQPNEGAKVAFIGANPHLRRMGMATKAMLRKLGRDDLQLSIGGPSIPATTRPSIPLGELARTFYEIKRLPN